MIPNYYDYYYKITMRTILKKPIYIYIFSPSKFQSKKNFKKTNNNKEQNAKNQNRVCVSLSPNTKSTKFLDLSCKCSFRENALYDFTNGAELKT